MIKNIFFSNRAHSVVSEVFFLWRSDTTHPVYCCSFHQVKFLFCKMGFSLFLSWGIIAADDSTTKRNQVSLLSSHWHEGCVVCLAASGSSEAEMLLHYSLQVEERISFSLNQYDLTVHSQCTRLLEVIHTGHLTCLTWSLTGHSHSQLEALCCC